VNTIIVLGSARINTELVRRLASEKTSLGEPISIVLLDKSEGVVERDDAFMKQLREATIKEYFFGDFKRSLDPTTQIIDYDTLTIYKIPERKRSILIPSTLIALHAKFQTALEGYGVEEGVVRAEADPSMESWILTVMNASNHDSVETIQQANVLGFLHVASVDESRRKLRVLAPSAGRLGDRPVIWGRWPEPNLNLLG
jgi:polyribonucleotide 5'-hydroxyl-kinase